jgi:hypothetical protein
MRATPGFVSPFMTLTASMSDQIMPSWIGIASGVVFEHRAMTMSGLFSVSSSQLVKGERKTADALLARTSNKTNVTTVFMLI